jgi:hypothetical protein
MDDEQHTHLQAVRQAYQRRLYKLEEQAATFGFHTPPHVSTEIDTVRGEIARLDALLGLTPSSNLPEQDSPHEERANADMRRALLRRSKYEIRAKGDVAIEGSTIDKRTGGVFVENARIRGNIQGQGAPRQEKPARTEPDGPDSDRTEAAAARDDTANPEEGRQ